MSDTPHDSSVPGDPAYPFTVRPPERQGGAGWLERPALVPGAGPGTRCVHGGVQPDPAYGAVTPPLHLTSTFAFQDVRTNAGFDYTRSGNPTRAALEEALALLEGGSGATCTATGMSAILVALSLLPQGARVLATVDCYGGTFRLLEHLRRAAGLDVAYLDLADLEAVEAALPGTSLVWVETPSNPLLRLTDLAALSALAHREPECLVAVDNTFLTPLLQRPFDLGADVVVHSTTKYLNGHSDVVGGAVVAAPGRPDLASRLAGLNNLLGTSQAPHDTWLVLRGLRTLPLRMARHEATAHALARHLETHPAVAKVHYPGLASHRQHALARRQQAGFGAMVSFELAQADPDRVDRVLRAFRWFTLAESLGGVESLVAHPATMTHASMTAEARERAGIGPGLLRLSVGLEDLADLQADLDRALSA